MGCCIYEIEARGEQVGQAKQTIICVCEVCEGKEREKNGRRFWEPEGRYDSERGYDIHGQER